MSEKKKEEEDHLGDSMSDDCFWSWKANARERRRIKKEGKTSHKSPPPSLSKSHKPRR